MVKICQTFLEGQITIWWNLWKWNNLMEIRAPRMKIQKMSLNFGKKFFKHMFPKIIKKNHVKKCVFTYPISAPASWSNFWVFDLFPLTINLEKKRSLSLNNFPPFSKNSGDINTQYMTNSTLVPGQNGIWVNILFWQGTPELNLSYTTMCYSSNT